MPASHDAYTDVIEKFDAHHEGKTAQANVASLPFTALSCFLSLTAFSCLLPYGKFYGGTGFDLTVVRFLSYKRSLALSRHFLVIATNFRSDGESVVGDATTISAGFWRGTWGSDAIR